MIQAASRTPGRVSATTVSRPQSQLTIVWRQLRRNRAAMLGAALISLEILIAVFAPLVAPYDPIEQSIYDALQPPSAAHWLGTDEVGRDILSRIIYGTRISLRVGLLAVGIGSAIGVTLGLIAGFYGKMADNLILRLMDIWLAFPGILLALAIIAVLGPSLFNVMIAVGLSAVPTYVRVTRSSVLSVREMEYVLGARAVGCPSRIIIWRHILPNVLPSLIVLTTLGIAGAILAAAALSFIGLGAQPPTPEWGAMLTVGRQFMRQAWWVTAFPGLAIMITVLGINLLGDGLRDALDPRLRR
ncbi:MAG: ABC transporter permease [Caldilineaceae bacterium]|nr:ABC transporter permease [Caldilineaceae bacterium]